MAKKFDVTGEQYYKITGQLSEILQQIRRKGGGPINPELVIPALQAVVEGRFQVESIVQWLKIPDELIIKANTGEGVSEQEVRAVFNSYLHPDFLSDLIELSYAAPDTSINVGEMITGQRGNFKKIFLSLHFDLNKLCLTPRQIMDFCRTHRQQLRGDGCGTFFLYKRKKNNNFFVADVRINSDGLNVYVSRLGGDCVWYGDYRHRVVTPQLKI